jgi:hypothetical protein
VSAEHPRGPPFTVERYGTFGQSVIAERDWLQGEVTRLKQAWDASFAQAMENGTRASIYRAVLAGVASCATCAVCQGAARAALDVSGEVPK